MHKAKACIILCMDFRFQETIQKWIADQGLLGHADEIIVAGAARDIVKPIEPIHKESLLRQIELSVKLHDPDQIIVIDHQDCGGYAQDGTIPNGLSEDEDKKMHKEHLETFKGILSEKLPSKQIKSYYATLQGKVVEI